MLLILSFQLRECHIELSLQNLIYLSKHEQCSFVYPDCFFHFVWGQLSLLSPNKNKKGVWLYETMNNEVTALYIVAKIECHKICELWYGCFLPLLWLPGSDQAIATAATVAQLVISFANFRVVYMDSNVAVTHV